MKLNHSTKLTGPLVSFAILSLLCLRAEAQTSNIPARITQAVDEKNLVVLRGNVHPLARPEFDQGAVSDGQSLHRMLLLLQRSPDQEAALQKLLDDQQSKSSPNYHAWLTPAQFGQQFSPADADIQTVTSWLQSHGFQVSNVTAGRTLIEFSGTAGQVRTAFHTQIHKYTVNGEAHLANASDPQIPAALAPVVVGPVSLSGFPRKSYARILGQFRKRAGKTGLEPLFTFPNPFSGQTFYGLGPGDFATIYNSKSLIAAGNDGTGQTIAIVGETNINVQDVQQFRTMFGLPANFNASNVVLNGEDPGITSEGEEGEADLDVEWSGAVAPGATLEFVVSASTPVSAGIDLSALYIIEHNLAGVMSESYGNCETSLGSAGNSFYNSLWEQAAAQGITVVLAAGDGGSAGCDDFDTEEVATQGLAVSGLASTPFNVSVGGTDFDQVNKWATFWSASNSATGTSAESYIPEIPWNENCAQIALTGCGSSAPNGSLNIVAGSGGPSSVYGKPTWQMGVTGMPNDSHRDQPDVSLFASPGFDGTGYVYCQSDQTISGEATCDINTSSGNLDFGIVGGTSASAPSFAGIMALVNQYQPAHGGTNRQGNANYVLYALVKKSGASCASSAAEATSCIFNDVTHGNSSLPTGTAGVGTNSVPCAGASSNCSVTIAGSNGVLVEPTAASTEAWSVTPGYDMATGLGTINANNLVTKWGSVSTIPTTTTLTLSPATGITHGTNESVAVGVTVKADSGTGVPTGDVSLIATFANGTTQGFDQLTLSTGAINGAKTQSLPGGTYTVSAHYAGDGTNAPSDSSPVQVTVGQESSQAFIVVPTFDSQGNPLSGNATSVAYGSNYIVRMYVTGKNGVASPTGPPNPGCYQENVLTCPTGTITLTDNGALLGTGGGGPGIYNLNNLGYTRDLTPGLLGGVHSLAASYSGDNSYLKNAGAATLTVTPAATQTQMDSYLNYVVQGQTFQLEANVTSQLTGNRAYPGGTVTFYDGNTALTGPVKITQGGAGQIYADIYNISLSTPGPHILTAQYSGDSNYAASTSGPVTTTLLITTAMTMTETATNINYGQSITLTAVLTSNSKGPAITSQIFFGSNYGAVNNTTSTPGTDANGNQMLTVTGTFAPPGTTSVYAFYQGDANYAASSSQSVQITVNIPDFSLNLPAAPFNIPDGQLGALQISVAPASNSSSPVNLAFSGSVPVGYTCTLLPATVNLSNGIAGTASLTLTPSSSGAAVIKSAVKDKRGLVFPLPFGQNPFWLVSLFGGLAALLSLRWASKKRDLRPSFGFGLVFVISLIIGCGGGSSSFTQPPPPPPPPGPFATSTTVLADSAKVAQNANVTFTATVTGQGSPTGNVTFYWNGNFLGQSTLTSGTAMFQTSFPNIGLYAITAQYAGNSDNLTSTSPSVNESVTGSTVLQITGNTGLLVHNVNLTVTLQ